ncbi:MAG: hypothetical protein K9J76_03410 [Polaromonas sp.]|nr:hypothetical protein [Polaromonas sp.]
METLNARIARLASALHVPLNDPMAIAALMATHPVQAVFKERRKAALDMAHVNVDPDRREAHQHEELRGLLVLRYHMETTSLNDNGLLVTWEAMAQAEEILVRQGFKPGADGVGLDSFFNVA